jgi:hypothetical protein
MHAPQDAAGGAAVVVLHEVQVEAGAAERFSIPAFQEETAGVAEYAGLQQVNALQRRRFKLHRTPRRHR